MSETVEVAPALNLAPIHTKSITGADDVAIVLSGFNLNGLRFNASSTIPVTKESYKVYTFTAGAITIDLTSIVDAFGVTFSGSGLKVQGIVIINPAGNASINVAPGASNGYALFGAGNDITIPGNASYDTFVVAWLPEGTPDVAGGAKNIDVTGTGTESFKIGLILG